MRWRGRRKSSNVDDRRSGGGRRAAGGVGTILVVLVAAWIFGVNPMELLQVVDQAQVSTSPAPSGPGAPPPENDEQAELVSVVLADTETTWHELFRSQGTSYEEPTLVLFTDQVRSACGFQSAAVGPFYCPGDQNVYIDLGFFRELDQRFEAPGDFAQAYVVAHEVGHHVQNLLGISREVHQQRTRLSEAEGNEMSVRLELQADCFAGVWGHHANRQRNLLEPGDVDEGLAAAAAIGDDTLQRRAGRSVQPESWTHGSSDQRARWLRVGLETGDPSACSTFETGSI